MTAIRDDRGRCCCTTRQETSLVTVRCPSGSVPSGTVVQVVQAGFMIGERVLRPALVGVSKGGAKAAPTTDVTS